MRSVDGRIAVNPSQSAIVQEGPTCSIEERHEGPMSGSVVSAHVGRYGRKQGEYVRRAAGGRTIGCRANRPGWHLTVVIWQWIIPFHPRDTRPVLTSRQDGHGPLREGNSNGEVKPMMALPCESAVANPFG